MVNGQKPRVYVLGTGGSISFLGDFRADYINYSYSGNHLTIQQMLERVPEIDGFAETVAEQIINVGSTDVLPQHWVQLAQRINQIFEEDPQAAGVAVAHGTATLEETAYFLNLAVKSSKPVVVTGAMRPPTGMGTDADVNLMDCVRVAASPDSAGRGVLTVLNNEIQAARDVTKTNSYRLETFRSNELGVLGYADSDESVVFYRTPVKAHTQATEFDVSAVVELPRVDIAYAYAGADGLVIKALADAGVPGIGGGGVGQRRVFAPIHAGAAGGQGPGGEGGHFHPDGERSGYEDPAVHRGGVRFGGQPVAQEGADFADVGADRYQRRRRNPADVPHLLTPCR